MPEGLKVNRGTEETMRELLRSLLEGGRVSGVLALGRTGDAEQGVACSLFTDPDAFGADGTACPLLPFMPANAGGVLSRLTLKGPLTEPIAAVVKPCEMRAFIELVKLNQCSLDNILLISSTCGGVYPLDTGANGGLEKKLPGYWDSKRCWQMAGSSMPVEADLDVQCTLYLNTEKGAAFVDGLEGLEGTPLSGELESESIQRLHGQREAFREELFAGVEVGLKGLVRTFGRCIGCHACKTMCPICYCQLCYFDSQDCERSPEFYEGELARKGGLRVPPNTVFFQLGRLSHTSISCVGCGMCTDVCPADIPLSTLFSKVGASVQALFDYQPGKDVTEEIPLRTFEEEELVQVAT